MFLLLCQANKCFCMTKRICGSLRFPTPIKRQMWKIVACGNKASRCRHIRKKLCTADNVRTNHR